MRIPKIGELVIANVSKITQFGAYCKLPEYESLEVFMPIREVSSGWIKNIREFIHEGQNLVCKVVFYDKERNTIDISLKKVAPKEAKDKIGAYNLEKRLVALFQQALSKAGEQKAKAEITNRITSEFGSYTNFFQHATSNSEEFEKANLPPKLKSAVKEAIEANRKERKYQVSYIATLLTYNTTSGAEELRDILNSVKKNGVDISYISAPKYRFVADGKDFVDAENKIKKAEQVATSKLKKGVFKLEKEKLKREKEDILAQI